jgi:CDP-glycerol glycerophosphotransferase (TagB/SpsB family)
MDEDKASLAAFHAGRKREQGSTAVLCALPPDYTGERKGKATFASYRELVEAWLDTLSALPSVKLTFQLHPAIRPQDAALIRDRVPVSNSNITRLIAHCDVLVTSVSSIIRLAIAARKPVVNFDVYGFDYPDYVGAPGVFNVRDMASFRDALTGLAADSLYDEAVASMKAFAHRWGVLDRRAGDRLVDLVENA